MSKRIPNGPMVISIVALTILSACAAGQPPVIEKLDGNTAVTITYNRTPLILSPDTTYEREAARDYLQVGVIEVNQMGSLNYYVWLGISDVNQTTGAGERPDGFESIDLVVDGENIRLDVLGWTAAAIGAGEPVYEKLFGTSVDAYYQVSLDHIQMLVEAGNLEVHTTGSALKEFVPWYRQDRNKDELSEFLRTVLR